MTPERWRQVRSVFDQAVMSHPAERTDLIRERCGTDEDLLKEVQSLLACDGETGSPLQSPLKPLPAGSSADLRMAISPAAVLPERYEILGELGRGGMGIVYKARDRETGEVLAVKILKPEIAADLQIINRFKNELRLAHRITHRNVARLYEFHRAGEVVYLSMEYVEGESLRALLHRTGKLDIARGLEIVRQLIAGLAEAHRHSIAHRDLKPENILLETGGDLKVMDFGICRSYAANVTATGGYIGTPAYMAPEQAAGKPTDHRADIYSLGLILYEMYTGTHAFSGATPVAFALKQIQERPRPPRTLVPELPAHLDEAILKCLEKDPADRFQSVEELLRTLEGNVSGSAAGSQRSVPRRRLVMAAGILALAVVASALSGTLWLGRGGGSSQSVQDLRSIAVLPFIDNSLEKNLAYFSDGLAQDLLNAMATIPGLRVAGSASSFQFRGKTANYREIGNKLNVAAILEGSLRKQGNRARINVQLIKAADGFQLWSATYDKDMSDIFNVQEEIARAVMGALKVTLLGGKAPGPPARIVNVEGYNFYLQGRYFLGRRAKENVERAVDYFSRAIKLDSEYAPAWVGLGEAHTLQAMQDYVPREEGFQKAQYAIERALVLDAHLGQGHAAMGRIKMYHDWDWAGADASFQRALDLQPGDPKVIGAAAALAGNLGRLDMAVTLNRRALEIDPLSSGRYHNVSNALYNAGRYDEAIAALKKTMELAPEREIAHCLLAQVYLAKLQPREALVEAEKETSPVFRLVGLALAYHAQGRKKESDANLAKLIATQRTEGPYQIAEVYAFRGETDRAFEWLERAYTERDAGLAEMKADPLLKSLERDPRYQVFLKKMRLPL